jgi:hypothetical protein
VARDDDSWPASYPRGRVVVVEEIFDPHVVVALVSILIAVFILFLLSALRIEDDADRRRRKW